MGLVGNEDGPICIVLNRDMIDVFAASRETYLPKTDVLGLVFRLDSLFATGKGNLLCRNFKNKILPLGRAHHGERTT